MMKIEELDIQGGERERVREERERGVVHNTCQQYQHITPLDHETFKYILGTCNVTFKMTYST